MKRSLGLVAALLLGVPAAAQFITPLGVFGGPPASSQLPTVGLTVGQIAFTSDLGIAQWNGGSWVAFSGGGVSVPVSANLLGSNSLGQLIAPTFAPYTVMANGTGSVGVMGPVTTIPASTLPAISGDCQFTVGTAVITCTQAAANFNVIGTLSMGTLNPPTNTFAPQEIDFTGIGTGGVVLVNGIAGSVTTGTYTAVSGTGGTGSGVVATVVSTSGTASSVTITTAGSGYKPGDSLSFNTGSGTATALVHTTNNPVTRWISSSAGTNYGAWNCYGNGGASSREFICAASTDTFNTERRWLDVTGTSTYTVGDISFGNATDNNTTHFLGTGTVSMAGSIAPLSYTHGSTTVCSWGASAVPQSGTVYTHTGDSSEFNLAQCSVAANLMAATGGTLRVTVLWYRSATTTDTVTYTIRAGTAGIITGGTLLENSAIATSGTQAYRYSNSLTNSSASVNIIGNQLAILGGFGTASGAASSTTLATGSAFTVNFNCQNTTSTSDTCGVLSYQVEVVNP